MGVVGSVDLLQNANLSSQPVSSLDWSPDKVEFSGSCVTRRTIADFARECRLFTFKS